jgi:transposase-like protein
VNQQKEIKLMRYRQVEQLLASNLTITEWCRLNNVAKSTLYKWLKRYRAENLDKAYDSGKWIEVTRQTKRESTALATVASMQDTIVSTANIPTSTNTPQANSFATSSTPLQVTPSPLHEITVDIAGIKVAIPQGADSSHIKSVLSAVVSL